MTKYVEKIIHNGTEYTIGGSSSGGDSTGFIFFGGGSDGECIIDKPTTIPARTYEFTTLCIKEGAKLSFCGNGIPAIKATDKIVNLGIIDLRSDRCIPCITRTYSFLGEVSNMGGSCGYATDTCYACKGGTGGSSGYSTKGYAGGGRGQNGKGSSSINTCNCGKAYGCNGGGGAGGFGGRSQGYYDNEYRTTWGQDATADKGGDGGNGCNATYSIDEGGGGGGFGYFQGGNGGSGLQGGCGGDSLYGNAGNAGRSISWNRYRAIGSDGGNSYYGNGGNGSKGGEGDDETAGCKGGDGGCSVWGNGGKGGEGGDGENGRGGTGGAGGDTYYGRGGDGGDRGPAYYTCCVWYGGYGGHVLGGQYGLLLSAPIIHNCCIEGHGGDAGNNGISNGGGRNGIKGGAGANVHLYYGKELVQGIINNKPGKGGKGSGSGSAGPDGDGGQLVIKQLTL